MELVVLGIIIPLLPFYFISFLCSAWILALGIPFMILRATFMILRGFSKALFRRSIWPFLIRLRAKLKHWAVTGDIYSLPDGYERLMNPSLSSDMLVRHHNSQHVGNRGNWIASEAYQVHNTQTGGSRYDENDIVKALSIMETESVSVKPPIVMNGVNAKPDDEGSNQSSSDEEFNKFARVSTASFTLSNPGSPGFQPDDDDDDDRNKRAADETDAAKFLIMLTSVASASESER